MSATNRVMAIGGQKDQAMIDLGLAQVASDLLSAKHRVMDLALWAESFGNDPVALVGAGWDTQKAADQLAAIAVGLAALDQLTSNATFKRYLGAGLRVF